MKHSTFLFYLILIPGVSFLTFFFHYTISLFSIFAAFLTHLCLGMKSLISAAPTTLALSIVITLIAGCMFALFITKTFSFLITFWRIKHLALISNTDKFKHLTRLKKTYGKVKIFRSSKPIAFCYFNTIFLSSGLLKNFNGQELEAVFLHEYVHVFNYHSVKTWLIELINKCMLIPIFSHFIRDFRFSLEVEADQFVIASQGTNQYLRGALLKTISYPDLNVNQFNLYNLEDRINAIKKKSVKKNKLNILFFSALLLQLCTFMIIFHHTKTTLAMTEEQIHQDAVQCSASTVPVYSMTSQKNFSSITD